MITKKCCRCKQFKIVSLFGVDKKTKDGLKCTCNDCRKIESKNYREKNHDKRSETLKKYYLNNKEKELLRLKKYRIENSEKRKQTVKNWYINNKEKSNETAKKWKQQNRLNNPMYKAWENLRSRTKDFLFNKNNFSKSKTLLIIGCTPDELKHHIENQFKTGMSWDNYGFYGWHIDHIIPLSSAKDDEELLKLCHYSNLQPLWMLENLKKGNKIV